MWFLCLYSTYRRDFTLRWNLEQHQSPFACITSPVTFLHIFWGCNDFCSTHLHHCRFCRRVLKWEVGCKMRVCVFRTAVRVKPHTSNPNQIHFTFHTSHSHRQKTSWMFRHHSIHQTLILCNYKSFTRFHIIKVIKKATVLNVNINNNKVGEIHLI